MKHHISILFLGVWLLGCQQSAENGNNIRQKAFATRSDTEIYFKNVRQLFYHREEQAATQLHLYRLHQTPAQLSQEPDLALVIVHNWRYNEAYILLEPNALLAALNTWEIEAALPQGKISQIQYRRGDKAAQQQFAYILYEALKQNATFQLRYQGKKIPFLARAQAREAARITLKDYRKMVGAEE